GILRRRLLVEIAIALVAVVVGERRQKRVHRRRRRTPPVGPQRDLALRAQDLLDELLEILAPQIEQRRLQHEPAQDREDLALLRVRLRLELLPGRLALLALLADTLQTEPPRLVKQALPLA